MHAPAPCRRAPYSAQQPRPAFDVGTILLRRSASRATMPRTMASCCSGEIWPAAAISAAPEPGASGDAALGRGGSVAPGSTRNSASRTPPVGPVAGRALQKPAPDLRASFGRPSCSATRPEKYRARKSPGSRRERAIERALGLGGDDSVRRAGQAPRRGRPRAPRSIPQPQRIAPRLHGVVVTAEPHIDRADDLPAAAVLGITFEMGFHPRDQIGNGPLSGGSSRRAAWDCAGRSGEPSVR